MITDTVKIPLCRHIKTNGRRCQSPALTGGVLCYFHSNLHHAHRRPPVVEALSSGWQESAVEAEGDPEGDAFALARVYPRQDEIQFPPLEDAESIQVSISLLVAALARNRIDSKRAAVLLYGLQLASSNARSIIIEPATASIVRTLARTKSGIDLAAND